MAKATRNLLVCLDSLRLCLVDRGKEVGRLGLEPPGVQWFLLINGSWRFLGLELSALLEVGLDRGDTALVLPSYLKVDLKQMTTTSPLFAPLRRVQVPAGRHHGRQAQRAR